MRRRNPLHHFITALNTKEHQMKINVFDSRRGYTRVGITPADISSEVSIAEFRKIEALKVGEKYERDEADAKYTGKFTAERIS